MKKLEGAFASGKKEVVLKHDGEDILFTASEIGFLAYQNIALRAAQEGKNALALIVAECVTDASGNRFTYDEVLRLKREYAEPLFEAVAGVNGATAEKN